jgi:hypothetical protein
LMDCALTGAEGPSTLSLPVACRIPDTRCLYISDIACTSESIAD